MILLHIGAGKCGSSALQTFFSNNPIIEFECGQKVIYHILTPKGLFSGDQVKNKANQSLYGYVASSPCKKLNLEDISDNLRFFDEKHIHIFSCEHWINEYYEFSKLLDHFPGKINVVMFVRPQVPLMNSAFWQWGAWSDQNFDEWIKGRVNFSKWYEKYKDYKKLDKIGRLDVQILGQDIVSDFFGLLEKKIPANVKIINSRNKSLPGELLRLMQRNRHLRPHANASAIDFVLEKYFSKIVGNKTPWVIDKNMMQYIINSCLDDNLKLMKILDTAQKQRMESDERWWKVFDIDKIESVLPSQPHDEACEKFLVTAIETIFTLEKNNPRQSSPKL